MAVGPLELVVCDDFVVQGRSEQQRELLDAESVAGHLLKAGSVFAFLAEHREELFPGDMFADMYPSPNGAPQHAAEVMAAAAVAADAVRTVRLRNRGCGCVRPAVEGSLRAACHRSIHPSPLTYFRRRLAPRLGRSGSSPRSARWWPNRRAGGKTRRALDSAVLDDAVATQDTVTQLIAAIRR